MVLVGCLCKAPRASNNSVATNSVMELDGGLERVVLVRVSGGWWVRVHALTPRPRAKGGRGIALGSAYQESHAHSFTQ